MHFLHFRVQALSILNDLPMRMIFRHCISKSVLTMRQVLAFSHSHKSARSACCRGRSSTPSYNSKIANPPNIAEPQPPNGCLCLLSNNNEHMKNETRNKKSEQKNRSRTGAEMKSGSSCFRHTASLHHLTQTLRKSAILHSQVS